MLRQCASANKGELNLHISSLQHSFVTYVLVAVANMSLPLCKLLVHVVYIAENKSTPVFPYDNIVIVCGWMNQLVCFCEHKPPSSEKKPL